MKITGAKIEAFLRAPDPAMRAILLFGPDEGLVRERAQRLAKLVLDDLNDPFRVAEFTGAQLKDDPARLADEAAALAFGGGRRLVWVRQAADSCEAACKSFLELDTPADALVVLDADDLSPRSKLRKLFEAAKNAACIPCYADDARTLPDVIRQHLNTHGLSADRDAISLLAQSLGSDRSVTRGELDKLALYMGAEKHITAEHVRAAVGDSGAANMDDAIYAAAGGDMGKLETALTRLLADGTNAVQIVRAAQRHFQRLHLTRGHINNGMSADEAVKTLRPPLMFTLMDAFRGQLNLWSEDKLARAFEILTQAETDCKTTGLPADAVTGRALMALAQAARAGQGRGSARR
ncbi:MAG: DNA polymerase III subunit delta [Rhodospirillales bacterium]|nr:DNA polymerase III subunit delta [Rhodospirillales bacterium]